MSTCWKTQHQLHHSHWPGIEHRLVALSCMTIEHRTMFERVRCLRAFLQHSTCIPTAA